MNYLYKSLLCIILFLPMQSQDTATNTTELEKDDAIAFRLLGGMQGALNAYKAAEILGHPQEKMMQKNKAAGTFSQCLGQYLTTFGMMHEKKGSIMQGYKIVYALADKHYDHKPMTPQEQPVLIDLLEKAIKINHFKSLITIEVEIKKNGMITKHSFNLDQILAAIKQVPVGTTYSLRSILTNVGIATALALGAWVAYNAITDSKKITPPTQQPEQHVIADGNEHDPILDPEDIYRFELQNAAHIMLENPALFYQIISKMENDDPKESKKFLTDLFIQYPQLTGFKDMIKNDSQDPHDDGKFSTWLLDKTGEAINHTGLYVADKFGGKGGFKSYIKGLEKKDDLWTNQEMGQLNPGRKYGTELVFTLAKGVTIDTPGHLIKIAMDAPGKIYNLTTHITENIMHPSEELEAKINHELDNQTPEQMKAFYDTGYQEFTDHDYKIASSLGWEAMHLGFVGWGANSIKNMLGFGAKSATPTIASNATNNASTVMPSTAPTTLGTINNKITTTLLPNVKRKAFDTPQPFHGPIEKETITSKIMPHGLYQKGTTKLYAPSKSDVPVHQGMVDKVAHYGMFPAMKGMAGLAAISTAEDFINLEPVEVKDFVYDKQTGKKMLDETGTAIMQPVYNQDGTLKTKELDAKTGIWEALNQTVHKLKPSENHGGTKALLVSAAAQTADKILKTVR